MMIAEHTGWSERDILDLPLERGFQYVHVIACKNTDKGIIKAR